MAVGQLVQQRFVQRLDPAHVHDSGTEFFGGLFRRRQQGAEVQDGDIFALLNHARFTNRQLAHGLLDFHARAGAAGVAHRRGAGVPVRGVQQLAAFIFVTGRSDHHVRQAAHESEVKAARMGGAVFAHQAGAVDGESHIQILDRHIVYQLVVASLQERGVDSHNRFLTLAGEAGAEGDGVLFGDGDIVKAFREAFGEFHHAGAFTHGRGDGDELVILFRHVAQPLAEDVLVLGQFLFLGAVFGNRDLHLGLWLKLVERVVADGVFLGRAEAFALGGYDVQQLGTALVAQVPQGVHQVVHIVAVQWADVIEAEFLEQGARGNHALHMLFRAAGELPGLGNDGQDLTAALAHVQVGFAGENAGEIGSEASDILRDRHAVVVQDHQHVFAGMRGVIERLEGHAGGHGTIANNGHHLAIVRGAKCHTQCGTDRSAGMAHTKSVIGAFGTLGEAGQAALLAHTEHLLTAASQDLVRVSLMAHIPHQAIRRGVIDVVQGNSELYHAQAGAKMAAGLAHAVQQVFT